MNRLSRVLLAGLVMASSLIMPVGAWDMYSFVGDSVYFGTSVKDAVEFDSSSSSYDLISLASYMSISNNVAGVFEVFHEGRPGGDLIPDMPDFTEFRSYPHSGLPVTRYISASNVNWDSATIEWPSSLNNGDVKGVIGAAFSPFNLDEPVNYFDVVVDISSMGSFSAFELSGVLQGKLGLVSNDSWLMSQPFSSIGVIVNGALQRTFYSNGNSNAVDFGNSVFSLSQSVSSLVLRFYYPFNVSTDYKQDFFIRVGLWGSSSTFQLDILNGGSILDGYVDDAQDSINDWDSIESEFGSDATDGFNGLDLDNFTYPSDFLAAFSLVSGIFTDLWNCMGDFQIIYLLPLTLGICLLLVGRVSRSSVPSPPPLHTDLPVSNSLGPPSRPALKGGKR